MRRATKAIGVIVFCIGFVGLFGEAEALGAQLLWSAGSAALCLIGGAMVGKTAEEDEV